MSSANFALTTTGKTLSGGVTAVTGSGQLDVVSFLNAFLSGETYTVIFTDSTSAVQRLIGAGSATNVQPVFIFVYASKVYALAGATAYFSALDDPLKWNDLNGIGNGFVTMSNQISNPEDILAMALYQGKAVFCGRQMVQIWRIDADPANWGLQQIIQNVGTMASKSVQSLGELEVLMLSDSGIRSLRTRETSLSAFVMDIGSPVDPLVQTLLATLTETEKAASCAVIEPSGSRYWLFIPGHDGAQGAIYVLSYFPSSEIIAWSTYDPTYETQTTAAPVSGTFDANGHISFTGLTADAAYAFVKGNATSLAGGETALTDTGDFFPLSTTATLSGTPLAVWTGSLKALSQTAFAPQNFVVFNGKVFCRDADALYVYGGSDGNTYDGVVCQAEPPWCDVKSPATRKQITGVDAACQGLWDIKIGTNQSDEEDLKLVYHGNGSSFFIGTITVNRIAPFYKLRFESRGTAYAKFCSVLTHFQQGENK